MTSQEAAAIRMDLANIYQGLLAQNEAMTNTMAIVSAIHEELCKDPPKSKIPEALEALKAAIQSLETTIISRG